MGKKIRVKPGKPQSAASLAVGIIFLLIGIFIVIPSFGPFGIFWTAVVAVMIIMNAYNLFSKKGMVSHEINIDDDEQLDDDDYADAEQRLEKVKNMYVKGLITLDEYEAKKKEILDEI